MVHGIVFGLILDEERQVVYRLEELQFLFYSVHIVYHVFNVNIQYIIKIQMFVIVH